MPVIEKAIETAALMLGSDRSRCYCLEMICADFLAGANLDNGDPETLLFSMTRFFKFLPGEQRQAFSRWPEREGIMSSTFNEPRSSAFATRSGVVRSLRLQVLRRDSWRFHLCGTMSNLEVHDKPFAATRAAIQKKT
jgi:hypothetical protein